METVGTVCSACFVATAFFGAAFVSWLQGLPDWAIKYAGGRVMGHSRIYKSANPPFWDWGYWGCHFWPGCHAVVPFAAEVILTTGAFQQDAPLFSYNSCLTIISAVPLMPNLHASHQHADHPHCTLAVTCQICDTVKTA